MKAATPISATETRGARGPERAELLDVAVGHLRDRQTEDVLDLQRRDDRRDAGGEARRDRVRDELDEPPEAQGAHGDEQDARHQPRREQARERRTAT